MRKVFIVLFICVLAIILIALTPYFYGWQFQREYYQFIEQLNNQSLDKTVSIKINSYNRGWLQSTAKITITSPNFDQFTPPQPNKKSTMNDIQIESVIHHGPLMHVNDSYIFGDAYVESTGHLPTIVQYFLENFADIDSSFIQSTSLITDSGRNWNTDITIKPVSFKQFGKWSGLKGTIEVVSNDKQITRISSNLTYGSMEVVLGLFGLPTIKVAPLKVKHDIVFDENKVGWKGKASFGIQNVDVNSDNQSLVSLMDLSFDSTDVYTAPLYSLQSNLRIHELKLPVSDSLNIGINLIDNFNYTMQVKNVNLENYFNLMKSIKNENDIETLGDKLFIVMITKNSTLDVKTQSNTNLGPVNIALNVSFQDAPKDMQDLLAKYILAANINLSQALGEYIIKEAITPVTNTISNEPSTAGSAVNPEDLKYVIGKLIEAGYVVQQKDQYLISLHLQNNMIKLNNLPETDVGVVAMNLMQIFATLPSNPPKFVCYRMEKSDDKDQWISTTIQTKFNCYTLDSCSGGKGVSMGGCYKWATSPTEPGEAWNVGNDVTQQPIAPPPPPPAQSAPSSPKIISYETIPAEEPANASQSGSTPATTPPQGSQNSSVPSPTVEPAQTNQNSTVAPAVEPVQANQNDATQPTVEPTQPDQDDTMACYWLQMVDGENVWVKTIVEKKSDCYALDSCQGGKGTDGNCYKWASSPDVAGEPWNGGN